ncbi:MAG: hypothetical protein LBI74_08310 [Synergistaceae bacterium]|jgi:hypothetical protein|nr:hypothetical protein [Synergistaceae bacterium]
MHEIRPEKAPEIEGIPGRFTTIAVDSDCDIELTDILAKRQEWERSRGRGFSSRQVIIGQLR